MTLRLITRTTIFIGLFFLAAAILFSLITAVTPRLSGETPAPGEPAPAFVHGISSVPHPVDDPRFIDCKACHGPGGTVAAPPNHRTFDNETCSLCHVYPPPLDQAEQAAAAEAAGEPAQTFGWGTPLDEQAVGAFDLPDPCALGLGLGQIVTQDVCSVRTDGVPCVACHSAQRADAGVRLDNLEGKQDFIDRGYVERFVAEETAKPNNLKLMFLDWQERDYPD
jgi:hypothetical protein